MSFINTEKSYKERLNESLNTFFTKLSKIIEKLFCPLFDLQSGT